MSTLHSREAADMIDPDEALQILKEGNRGFLNDELPSPSLESGKDRRLEVARAQSPFAVLVSCSDSRVTPELLFGRGLGQLFIVRNAGNTVDKVALGSIEFAVHFLNVRLIVVLGHQRCGAVEIAVRAIEENFTFPGNLPNVIRPIIPAVNEARKILRRAPEGTDLVDIAVRENVRRVVNKLRDSEPIIAEAVRSQGLKIVGAYYALDDGHVEFLEE